RHIAPHEAVSVLPGPSGELVAYSLLWRSSDPTTRLTVEVAVHPDWRRRGIGSRLYALAEQQARQLGVAHITSPVYLPIPDLPPDPAQSPQSANPKSKILPSNEVKGQSPKLDIEA